MHRFLKAAVAAASGVALTFSVTVATETPAIAASGCKTTFTNYNTVKKGAHGSQAKAAQCLLRSAGYSVRTDGSFSAADSAQLKKFQRTHHVNVTGNVYASSWTALLSRGSRPTLSVGKSNSAVTRLQKSLTASGRYVPATGYFGSLTKNAVKSVQRAKGLRATGTANSSVWRLLQAGDPIVSHKAAVKKPATKKAATKKPAAKKKAASSSSSSKNAKALAFAKKQIGDRYRYGATGPNAWDCSGLTAAAWKSAGVKLPHSARQQFSRGKKVSKSNLKPGDLVFFYKGISHVGIYAGGGKVLHASRPGKPVGYLKMSYMPYQGARRPA
jgi:cell wall-associated NlpC family hydrolase